MSAKIYVLKFDRAFFSNKKGFLFTLKKKDLTTESIDDIWQFDMFCVCDRKP